MTERRKLRRHQPPSRELANARYSQIAVDVAVARFHKDVLNAAEAGWSMREIAEALQLSASTVCRIVNTAEQAA